MILIFKLITSRNSLQPVFSSALDAFATVAGRLTGETDRAFLFTAANVCGHVDANGWLYWYVHS